MRDVISSFFSEGRFESMVDQVRAAGSVTASSSQIASFCGSKVTKDVSRRVVEMFDSRHGSDPSGAFVASCGSGAFSSFSRRGKKRRVLILCWRLEQIAGQ